MNSRTLAYIAESNFVISLCEKMNAQFNKQIEAYGHAKKLLNKLTDVVRDDNAFVGHVLLDIFKNLNQPGLEVVNEIDKLRTVFTGNIDSLCNTAEAIRKLKILIKSNQVKAPNVFEDILSKLKQTAELHFNNEASNNKSTENQTQLGEQEELSITAIANAIETKINNPTTLPVTKNTFKLVQDKMSEIKTIEQDWKNIVERINRKDALLLWVKNAEQMTQLSDITNAINIVVADADCTLKELLNSHYKKKPAKKTVTSSTATTATTTTTTTTADTGLTNTSTNDAEKNKNEFVVKVRKQENVRNKLKRMLEKKKLECTSCYLEVQQVLLIQKILLDKFDHHSFMLSEAEDNKLFLEDKLQKINASSIVSTEIRAQLVSIKEEISYRSSHLKILTDHLSIIDFKTLQLKFNKLNEMRVLYQEKGQFENYLKLTDSALENFSKQKKEWTEFYEGTFDELNDQVINSSDFEEKVAKHANEINNFPDTLEINKNHLMALTNNAPLMLESFDDATDLTKGIRTLISPLQLYYENTESLLKLKLILSEDLMIKIRESKDLNKNENSTYEEFLFLLNKKIGGLEDCEHYNIDELKTIIALEESRNNHSKNPGAVSQFVLPSSSASSKPLSDEECNNFLIQLLQEDRLSDQDQDEKKEKKERGEKKDVKEKLGNENDKQTILNHNNSDLNATPASVGAFDIAKYFQNLLFHQDYSLGIGGTNSHMAHVEKLRNKDRIVTSYVTLPKFASFLSNALYGALREEGFTNLMQTRDLVRDIHNDISGVIKDNHIFRSETTQSLYYQIHRDSGLLQRILTVDAQYLRKTAIKALALKKPLLSSTVHNQLYPLIDALQKKNKEKVDRNDYVKAYTKAAELFSNPQIPQDERQYILECLLILGDVSIEGTLKKIKSIISKEEKWGCGLFTRSIPDHFNEIDKVLQSNKQPIDKLYSIMMIAQDCANHPKLTRSAHTQAIYQALGFGSNYFDVNKHYELRYADSNNKMMKPNEAVVMPTNDPELPWRICYISDAGLVKTTIPKKDLPETFVGKQQPLLDNDLLILGRLAGIPCYLSPFITLSNESVLKPRRHGC